MRISKTLRYQLIAEFVYRIMSERHKMNTGKPYYPSWEKLDQETKEGFYVKNIRDFDKLPAKGNPYARNYLKISKKNRAKLGWTEGPYNKKKKTTPLFKVKEPDIVFCSLVNFILNLLELEPKELLDFLGKKDK